MKKPTLLFVAAALMIAMSSVASAQTASGTLTVTANVQSTMKLVFNTDATGIALGGSGTSAASIALGTVQAFGGTTPTNVTNTTLANAFRLDTAFDINVQVANVTSTSYNLTAQLGAADGNTWQIGGVGVTAAAASPILASGTYATDTRLAFALTIPFAAPAGSISNTISFVASPN